MLVKICGIKTVEAADVAVKAGTDLIGFVFAPSKRQVTPTEAKAIAKTIPSSVQKVGVFVNETVENMKKIAEYVGLDFIQLHGNETADVSRQLSPHKVIKASPVNEVNLNDLVTFPCDYYLIDSPSEEYRGGSGKIFDWNIVPTLPLDPKKMILAGGLTSENVQRAISIVKPAGIDVSSGVETNGEKDHKKIKQFIVNSGRMN